MALDVKYRYPLVDDLPEDFKCPLCLDVLLEPMLTNCCGHHFCNECIDDLRQKAKPAIPKDDDGVSCPMCQCKAKGGFTLVLDKRTKRMLRSLKVECPNRQAGCEWIGDVAGLNEHVETRCKHAIRACTKGCGALLLPSELDEHLLSVCRKRDVVCQYCGEIKLFGDMESHCKVCPNMPVSCPNCCNIQGLTRRDTESHLVECPLQEVYCEFDATGCKQTLLRKDLSKHMETHAQHHLGLVLHDVTGLREALQKRDQTLAQLERKLHEKDQEVDDIRRSLYKMKFDFQQKLEQQSADLEAKLRDAEGHLNRQVQQQVGMHEDGQNTAKIENRLQTLELLIAVPPYYFTLTNYSLHKHGKTVWMCAPFFTSLGRYKMAVEVSSSGEGTGKNTHVSVYIRIMRGEYDHNLKWPLSAKVTVQLISQVDRRQDYELTTPMYTWERVTDGVVGSGWGWDKFIAHERLEYNPSRNLDFLKNDRLNFRVLCVNEQD